MRAVIRRAEFFVITLWAAVTINSLIPRLMPGSAVDAMMARLRGAQLSPSALKAAEAAFGGDTSGGILSQYVTSVGNICRGQFGTSTLFFPVPVTQVIGSALPWTVGLVGITTLLSIALGTFLGVIAAGGAADSSTAPIFPISLVLSAVPFFFVGLCMIYVFSAKLGWFPGGFAYDVSSGEGPSLSWSFRGPGPLPRLSPGMTILITSIGLWILVMRNNMVGTMSEDYVRLARAKGLSDRRVMTSYGARNALLPSMTGLALSLGFVVSGALLTEIVFTYPGWLHPVPGGHEPGLRTDAGDLPAHHRRRTARGSGLGHRQRDPRPAYAQLSCER